MTTYAKAIDPRETRKEFEGIESNEDFGWEPFRDEAPRDTIPPTRRSVEIIDPRIQTSRFNDIEVVEEISCTLALEPTGD